MVGLFSFITGIDSSIFFAINGLHAGFADDIMMFISHKLVWIPFYILLAYLAIRKAGLINGILIILCVAAAAGIADWICASIIKPYVERIRPASLQNPWNHLVHIVNGYRSGGYGFPSCHAANSFVLATLFSLVFRHRTMTAVLFIWAFAVGYSRIYLGVHYPGDVLAGATIGSVIAYAIYKYVYLRVLDKKLVEKIFFHKKLSELK